METEQICSESLGNVYEILDHEKWNKVPSTEQNANGIPIRWKSNYQLNFQLMLALNLSKISYASAKNHWYVLESLISQYWDRLAIETDQNANNSRKTI